MIRPLAIVAALATTLPACRDDAVTCDEDPRFGEHGSAEDARELADMMPDAGVVCASERDWYVIAAAEACMLTFDLTFDDADGDLGLAVYVERDDPSLVEQSFTQGDEEQVVVASTEARDYFAEVRAQGSGVERARASYELLATLECGSSSGSDTGGSTGGAT